MDDKKLDKLLHEMKSDYENLPKFVDNQTVMQSVFQKRQFNWNKYIPTLAAIAGLLIFVIITLGSIDSKQQMDKDTEDNGPLMGYFLDRKEAFQQSLGLEDVDDLGRVKHARKLVDHYEEKDNIEDGKHTIYQLLETPTMKIESFNNSTSSSGAPDYFVVQDVIAQLKDFQMTFQFLLDNRIANNMSKSEKQTIIEYQNDLQEYNFPDATEKLLSVFNKQGYFITLSEDGKMTAKVDYLYVIEKLDFKHSKSKAYKDYLWLLGTEIDPEKPGIGNDYGIEWTAFDEVLLSVEEFYSSYKNMDEQYRMFKGTLFHYTTIYLNDYLSAGVDVGDAIPKDGQQELKAFLKGHKKSKFWNLVYKAVEQYENNDWIRTNYKVSDQLVSKTIEADREYGGMVSDYDNKLEVTLLPLKDALLQTYEKYKESKDLDLLKDLSAFKVMQLFMYASDKGDFDTYYSLYDTNGVLADVGKEEIRQESAMAADTEFQQLAEKTNYILVDEKQEKKETIFYFVPSEDTDTEMRAFRMVQNEKGIWKVPYMPMQ